MRQNRDNSIPKILVDLRKEDVLVSVEEKADKSQIKNTKIKKRELVYDLPKSSLFE